MPFLLTFHALSRIEERDLCAEHLCAALENGRPFRRQSDGRVLYRDPRSRVAVVVDPQTQTVVTAMRLTRRQLKAHYSR